MNEKLWDRISDRTEKEKKNEPAQTCAENTAKERIFIYIYIVAIATTTQLAKQMKTSAH